MGCPLSKSINTSPRHSRPNTSQQHLKKPSQNNYMLPNLPKEENQENPQPDTALSLFTKKQDFTSHQFNFSSQSDFETFITLSISDTELISIGLKIQLNPYSEDKIINENSNIQDILHLIQKNNEMPTLIYNTGIHDEKIFLEKANLLIFQKFLYENILSFFKEQNRSINKTLIIEISSHQISRDDFFLTVNIYHPLNFPDPISITFPATNREDKSGILFFEAPEPKIESHFLKKLDLDNTHILKSSQKRLLLLDDQFIQIKILLIQLCHEENPHLTHVEKTKLKKILSHESLEEFKFIWNKSLFYIDLSDDFKIYLARNIENAKRIVHHAYPNYIISDQNLERTEEHIELGTDFLHYVLAQEYTDQMKIQLMIYSANGSEISVTKKASELKQIPSILEKGKPGLHTKIFDFLSGNNSFSST